VAINDNEPPTDEISSEDDRARILQDALAFAEGAEAVYRQPLPEAQRVGVWKVPLAFVVLALAAYIAAFPPAWIVAPTASLTADDIERGIRATMELQAEQIGAFRVRHDRLPHSLDELPASASGIRFVRTNNRVYQLVATSPSGHAVVYDSTKPSEEFERLSGLWRGSQDRP
jgi:hypothetical protein